jgi:hypothetical protein
VRRWHLDAVLLINVSEGNVACPSMLASLSLRIPYRSIRDYNTFSVQHNFKVSPCTRCVSAANAVCRNIDIFNKNCILLCKLVILLFVILVFYIHRPI